MLPLLNSVKQQEFEIIEKKNSYHAIYHVTAEIIIIILSFEVFYCLDSVFKLKNTLVKLLGVIIHYSTIHCITLVSLPPVEIRRASSCMNLTDVT